MGKNIVIFYHITIYDMVGGGRGKLDIAVSYIAPCGVKGKVAQYPIRWDIGGGGYTISQSDFKKTVKKNL